MRSDKRACGQIIIMLKIKILGVLVVLGLVTFPVCSLRTKMTDTSLGADFFEMQEDDYDLYGLEEEDVDEVDDVDQDLEAVDESEEDFVLVEEDDEDDEFSYLTDDDTDSDVEAKVLPRCKKGNEICRRSRLKRCRKSCNHRGACFRRCRIRFGKNSKKFAK